MNTTANKKKIMITVDVEAQPRRAESDPVDRLIWGKFPGGQAGIGEMMSIAQSHDARLTMFLDYCERDIHGDLIMDVGREIHGRGHDLQLHAHPDFMSNDFWAQKGVPRILNLNETTAEQAKILVDFLVMEHERCTGEKPVAYRGGGYRFNQHLLNAFAKQGVLFQSSYNPPRKTQPLKFDFAKQFKWSNGCVEIPISCVKKYKNLTYPLEFNFNVGALSDVRRMTTFLDLFHKEFGDDAIAVLVMHSWSLLKFDADSGYFTHPLPGNAERLDAFLKAVSKTHDIVTATDVLALDKENKIALDPVLDIDVFKPNGSSLKKQQESTPDMKTDDTLGVPELLEKAEQLWNDSAADPDKTHSVALFHQAYERGDRTKAGYRLGTAYYNGTGAEKDISKAYDYFSIPELNNTRYALFYRGRILKSDTYFGQNKTKAWQALNKAAELGLEAAKEEMQGLPVPSIEPVVKECPICGADGTRFEKMQGRQCPDCGSVERQRVFVLAYDEAISNTCDLAGKHGLIISPAVSERKFFKSRKVGKLTSVDVRPEAKPDIVADICDMSHVKSETYDFVYASYVFACVHDLDAAFAEIQRVLKPGGCLLSIDHITFGAQTQEFTERDKITSWYGDENFDKYKVGSFRKLGEQGLVEHLSQYFNVQTCRATDPVTDLEMAVVVSKKAPSTAQNLSTLQTLKKNILHQNNYTSFDAPYIDYKKKRPKASYSQFVMEREYNRVQTGIEHASLGRNITEHGQKAAPLVFDFYQELFNFNQESKILEYGCGSLRLAKPFIEYLDEGKYFGLDVVSGFFETGKNMLGAKLIDSKKVECRVIDEQGVSDGQIFQADIIFSNSVAYHVHPDDVDAYFSNLITLCQKRGARLIFDAKLSDKPLRYSKNGWAWPLDFYKAMLSPLEFIDLHREAPYPPAPGCTIAHFEFVTPR